MLKNRFTSFKRPYNPRSLSPSVRPLFATAPTGLVPERPRASSLPPLETEKTREIEDEQMPISEKTELPQLEQHQEEASFIDPGFMRDVSTIMEEPSLLADSRRSSARQSQIMSRKESTSSRQSNVLSASIKSDSTIILPAPSAIHSRHSSEAGSMFAPTRLNSAVGPWRDSIWSTAATPTGIGPPLSAYASQRQSRRSFSLSARAAQARDSNNWIDDVSPRSSGGRPLASFILPPLPTPGFRRDSENRNSNPQNRNTHAPSSLQNSRRPS
ncbi:hypothetical protein MMC10_009067 [Thelotrema lepadinum]|nr:hypothetical protein [Thelotrema lepadinum]